MKCCVLYEGCDIPCGNESGDSIVCTHHRKYMSRPAARNADREWHERISRRGFDVHSNLYRCFHCGLFFPHGEICGDHFPYTKAARPDLRYDMRNGVPCCRACNVSDSETRRASLLRWKKEHSPLDLP